MEDWVTIRNLKKKNPSLGTRAIAKLVGVSRSTVKKALVSEQYPSYSRDKKVNTAIEPFKEYIKECYLIKKQKVSVILESLRSKGFSGSGISLYRYIGEHLKPEQEGGRAFMPYETMPGEQMLYDWADYSVELGSELVKVYVHLTELGWSRYKVLSASLSIKQSDVLEAMEDAFFQFGGVASRIQVDNA
jgi:transposase